MLQTLQVRAQSFRDAIAKLARERLFPIVVPIWERPDIQFIHAAVLLLAVFTLARPLFTAAVPEPSFRS